MLEIAARSLKRTHPELGSKAPVIMFDDANLGELVAGVRTFGFCNAGRDCNTACRTYAHRRIHDKLVADLSSAVATIQLGAQEAAGVKLGPLVSAAQRDRVAGFIERAAVQKHIDIATGGKVGTGNGFFFQPTVVAGAKQSDEIVRKEVFGPVVSVTRFDDTEQVIGWANEAITA